MLAESAYHSVVSSMFSIWPPRKLDLYILYKTFRKFEHLFIRLFSFVDSDNDDKNTHFATSDRNVKSNFFIDVLISRQPIYYAKKRQEMGSY